MHAALLHALLQCGLIDERHARHPTRAGWSHAASGLMAVRAAVGDVVALRLAAEPSDFQPSRHSPALVQRINEHLPLNVRVLAAADVGSSFDARAQCTSRLYHYYVPVAALTPAGALHRGQRVARSNTSSAGSATKA
jgi:tRNA U38,U39,U40 pseudouridine synthase TruA